MGVVGYIDAQTWLTKASPKSCESDPPEFQSQLGAQVNHHFLGPVYQLKPPETQFMVSALMNAL